MLISHRKRRFKDQGTTDIHTYDDLRRQNCPFIQERTQRVMWEDIGYRTALGVYDMIRTRMQSAPQ